MMRDEYSIELRSTQIYDNRTKEYFSEVFSSYSAGNYRSSVVMLWTVVICDLIFKLQELAEFYEDDRAKEILSDIEKIQNENKRSANWESVLIESVAKKTELIDINEKENLNHLQMQRHLSAHPVINSNFQLHCPTHEDVRALIRNSLDIVLTKPSILSKKIVNELVMDIAQNSEFLPDASKLESYLEKKYFIHFSNAVGNIVLKAFWKFVFRSLDASCEKNRLINYSTFRLLFKRDRIHFTKYISENATYFSKIANKGPPLTYLIIFLASFPDVYNHLEGHAQTKIQQTANADPASICLSWFLSENLQAHADKLEKWIIESDYPYIEPMIWDSLADISDTAEWSKLLIKLGNTCYGVCRNFHIADIIFNEIIAPSLPKYDLDDCRDLIETIKSNRQTYDRGKAVDDHEKIRAIALKLDPAFDSSDLLP